MPAFPVRNTFPSNTLVRISLFLLLLGMAAYPTSTALADRHCVSKTDPACSSTIQAALNLASAGDTITISAATYNERITISKDITILGSTSPDILLVKTTIDGNGLPGSVVTIQNSAATVTLDTIKIINGSGASGGGINSNGAHLNLINSVITGNTVTNNGGGIYITGGSLGLTDTQVTTNIAANYGGGIFATTNANLTLNRTEISENKTNSVHGGGVYQMGGAFNASDSRISGNTAHGGGGGLFFVGVTATLERVTINGNQALGQDGGGIDNQNSSSTLTNVTLSGNSVISTYRGGAIYNTAKTGFTSSVALNSVTVANNSAAGSNGGGLAGYAADGPSAASYSLSASLFADNTGGNCHDTALITFLSLDFNISDDATCPLPFHADLVNTDPLLMPLAYNPPGYVWTHALQDGSPAIRHAESCPPVDARGTRRAVPCAVGAWDQTYWLNLVLITR